MTPEEFRACVQHGVVPVRSALPPVADALPVQLVHALIRQANVPESEVARMTKDEAIARLSQHWAEQA